MDDWDEDYYFEWYKFSFSLYYFDIWVHQYIVLYHEKNGVTWTAFWESSRGKPP